MSGKSKDNDQTKKDKKTNNDLQNTAPKREDKHIQGRTICYVMINRG